ncbi:MAG: hypothetical protein LBI79_08475 [Nitrososphaerota archaeon]|nr:hypothetical protein [Nitrososphaerota archaeon]
MPKSLDQCMPQDHICRGINAFTQTLDIQKLGYKYGMYSLMLFARL